jgi:hypothetical protein
MKNPPQKAKAVRCSKFEVPGKKEGARDPLDNGKKDINIEP